MAENIEEKNERAARFVWAKTDIRVFRPRQKLPEGSIVRPRRFDKEFTCFYCGLHRYHLPGEHDQCDHSPTGECVDPEFESKKEERGRISSGDKLSGDLIKEGQSGKFLISPTKWGGRVVLNRDGDEESAKRLKGELNSILSKVPDEHLRGLKRIDAAGHGLSFLGSATYIPPSKKRGFISDEIFLGDRWHAKIGGEKETALLHEIGHRFQTVVAPYSFKSFKAQDLDKRLGSVFDDDWKKEFLPVYKKQGGDAIAAEVFAQSYAKHLNGSLEDSQLKAFWDKQFKLKRFSDKDIYIYQQSPAERRVDFAAIKKALDDDQVSVDLALRVPIRKVLDDLVTLIKEQDKRGGITDSFVMGLTLTTGPEAQKILGDYLLKVWKRGRGLAVNELPEKLHDKIRKFAGLEPVQAINFFQNLRPWLIKGIIDDELKKTARLELTEHLKGGRTITETIGNLRSAWEPWIGNPTKVVPSGISGTAEDILQAYRLENIVRTEAITALSQGRAEIADEAGDFVIGFELSPILDVDTHLPLSQTRGSLPCNRIRDLIDMDRPVRFKKDDLRSVKLLPPLLYNCRTIEIFITSDDLPIRWSTEAELDSVLRLVPEGFK